jgi:transketolase N-terminal domain/subunit
MMVYQELRIASGSLGQGLSVAIGAAQAKKLNNDNHYHLYTSRRW